MAKRKTEAERLFDRALRRRHVTTPEGGLHAPTTPEAASLLQRSGVSPEAPEAAIAARLAPSLAPQGGTTPSGSGIEIMAGTENQPPHTYKTASGAHCQTDRWFDSVFLCFDSALDDNSKGGKYNPWMGLAGRNFRCYYPGSSSADFKACMTSGSSGRWLQSWGQRSNYVRF